MPYIVKSSIEVGSTIVPFNERESQKLIKEKQEYLKNKQKNDVLEKVTNKKVDNSIKEESENEEEIVKTEIKSKKVLNSKKSMKG